ncbi:YihY/virulence factor BrkB family protein [Roseomonas sp. NAR14]|uniref:YihY/virulence factor BrkB family protein n=1 Tax=Roseomonas acroporae TaxID=2937791 RepID=A0A9X1Y8B5_9PROT|nr:YihY/virulence factor BrkB family protein [Roseomonas acroporae]MCK8786004.1 YihY/virulence factor BrkB family protein [Roseomonas acroporae]
MPAAQRLSNALLTAGAAMGLAALLLPDRQRRAAARLTPDAPPEAAIAAANGAGPVAPPQRDPLGRTAEAPHQIPARGWWSILKRTFAQVNEDRVMANAAGITFYALLSVFPTVAALVSLYALFADPATIGKHLSEIAGFVPQGGMEIITDQIKRVAAKADGTLGVSAIIGLATSLWSANQGMKALFDSLNVVYEEEEKRSFVWLNLVSLTFTVGSILFVLLAMGAVVVLPIVLNLVYLGDSTETLLRWVRWPVLFVGITVFLSLIYRYGPSRERARWSWVSWGGGVASLAWLGLSAGFSVYVSNFGNYNETYGSLGAAIGFMTWIWLSSIVVLVGGELNAEMEHQTAQDTTTGAPKPLGQRRARMADEVAPA